MTDTTDIAALRSKAANVIGLLTAEFHPEVFALDSLVDVFDDMFRLLEAERQRADAAQTLLMPDGLHENTKALVIGFANAMAAKLYKSEQKYGWSDAWLQDDWQNKCLTDFNHHISKGDPLDVANYCAFMHYHGWSTAPKGSLGSVSDWEIDHSTGVPILVYKKCSVIESEQAYGLLNLIKQSELKGEQVPVDSDSFSLIEAACEQWKLVSIEANKKVAALGDENRKLRTEIAKINAD